MLALTQGPLLLLVELCVELHVAGVVVVVTFQPLLQSLAMATLVSTLVVVKLLALLVLTGVAPVSKLLEAGFCVVSGLLVLTTVCAQITCATLLRML